MGLIPAGSAVHAKSDMGSSADGSQLTTSPPAKSGLRS
jgi:hypothetical protein